jgi:PIN domain nuclease of toxin-antitoxin system
MILLDTHAWVWFVADPGRLSHAARDKINNAVKIQQVYISTISTWEVAMLVKKGRLELTMNVEEWIFTSERLPFFHFVPIDTAIAVQSVNLPGKLHDDPADRIIIATARKMNVPIISKDKRILSYPHVSAVW